MIRSTLLALCLVPGLAHAKKPAWFADGNGDVAISGVVEVPLYRTPTSPFAIAQVDAELAGKGEAVESTFLELTADGTNQITKDLAKALGLGKSVDKGFAVIPEVRIGEFVLSDVRASIGPTNRLGLGALSGFEVAIQPSKGTVSFGAPGAGLVDGVGTAATYSLAEGKWDEHGMKIDRAPVAIKVPGAIGELNGYFYVAGGEGSLEGYGSEVAKRGLGEERVQRREKTTAVLSPTLSGVSLAPAQFVENGGLHSADDMLLGVLRADTLYNIDLAFDLDGSRVALSVAESVKWADGAAKSLEWARADFEEAVADAAEGEADEGASEDAEDSEGPDGGDQAVVGRELAFADALWSAGKPGKALKHYSAAADASGETCVARMQYGQALLWNGAPDKAATELLRSAEAYDAWWGQSRETRKAITEGDDVAEGAYTLAQDASCHKAWGLYASSLIAQGKADEVPALYEAHVDLDPDLAKAYGMALLNAGDWSGANGAFRKALNMGARSDGGTRVGLSVANVRLDRSAVLDRQADAIRGFSADVGLVDALSIAMVAGDGAGSDGAIAAAKAFADDNSLSVGAQLSLALVLSQAGSADDAKAIADKVLPLAEAAQLREAGTAQSFAHLAVTHALRGDTKRAAVALDSLGKAPVDGIDALVAEAIVRGLNGESDKAGAAWTSASKRAPLYPLPVMLKK